MNYKSMSDFEINKLAAGLVSLIINEEQMCEAKKIKSSVMVNDIVNSFEFNPCENPSDAWPIMNDASIIIDRDSCQAHVSSYFNPSFVIYCKNDEKEILRASMIAALSVAIG